MSEIRLVSTGGTIANTASGRLGIDEVLTGLLGTEAKATLDKVEITIDEVLRDGGERFAPAEWLRIGQAVQAAADDSTVDGIVVTHGTYTAEETAYFLHLATATEKPVVVVCSQRKHGTVGNDGDRNLVDAIRVASDPDAHGKGVLVVLGEEIHCAREVTKTNQRPGGFRSNSYGILGSIEADRVSFYRAPTRRHTHRSRVHPDRALCELPRVDVAYTSAGADGVAVDAFVEAGASGIVVNGFSFSGKPHHLQMPALTAAADRGVAVVRVNRGADGRIPKGDDVGFVCGDNLTAQKARVLLALALTKTSEHAELQDIFDEH